MTDQYINMDNLAVGYNGKALIHDICIGIEKGEIVTLIGPNGAGTVSYTHLTLPTTERV